MTERPSDSTSVSVGGHMTGSLVVGTGNVVTTTTTIGGGVLTPAEQAELRAALASLEQRATAEAPPELRKEAVDRVKELEGSITAERPDVSRMEAVWNWFRLHVPKLAGAVVSVVVNPIVGKLVEAGGESLVGEFRRRFPASASGPRAGEATGG